MSASDYHDFTQREADHIYVEVPDRYGDAEWVSSTRVAQHGADRLLRDLQMPRNPYGTPEVRDTFRLIWNWGSGPEVIVRGGVIVHDTRPKAATA